MTCGDWLLAASSTNWQQITLADGLKYTRARPHYVSFFSFFLFFFLEPCVDSVQVCGNTSHAWDAADTPLLFKKRAASICNAF